MVDLGGYVIILVETRDQKIKLYGPYCMTRNNPLSFYSFFFSCTVSSQFRAWMSSFQLFIVDPRRPLSLSLWSCVVYLNYLTRLFVVVHRDREKGADGEPVLAYLVAMAPYQFCVDVLFKVQSFYFFFFDTPSRNNQNGSRNWERALSVYQE